MKVIQLPNGWEWKQLGDLRIDVDTINPIDYPDTEFYYLDIDSVDNTTHTITNPKKIIGKDAPSRARQIVKTGDILFSTVRTNLKNIALVDAFYDNQIASTGFCVIRPQKNVDNKYLFYSVQTQNFQNQLEKFQRGANYPAVRDSDIFSLFIPTPPKPIQQQISAMLENAEVMKQKRMQADALTLNLLQSIFLEMFGDPVWNEKNWNKAILKSLTLRHKQGIYTNSKYVDNGTKLIRVSDINEDGTLNYATMPYLDLDSHTYEQFKAEVGDFIFARSGSIGRCAIVEKDTPCVFGSFSISFRFDPQKIDNKFFFYLIKSPNIQADLKKYSHGSANVNVNAENIQELEVITPPLPLQQEFAHIAKDVEGLRRQQQQSSEDIDILFDAVMQKAFRGELTL